MLDLYYCESGDHYYQIYDQDWRYMYEYERDYEEEYESGDFLAYVIKNCPNHPEEEE